MVTYKIVESCKGVCTYGIVAVDSEEIIAEISDISADKEAVAELAELMKRYQLSLIHFKDVIEDFLIKEY